MTHREVVSTGAVRLDAFVRDHLPGTSRQVVQRLIADGVVRVNGRPAAKGAMLADGDVVALPLIAGLTPQPDLAVQTIYVDAHLVVVDKPAGLRSHALDPRDLDTVANWLCARFPDTAPAGDPLGSGLAHRLDTGTSGLLIAARSTAAFAGLRGAFRDRRVEKRYRAIVEGCLQTPLRLTAPLAHDGTDRRRMTTTPSARRRTWAALTEVTPIETRGSRSLVEIAMRTGVTHQIRAHLAAAGHPIVGDALYGGSPDSRLAEGRHALHASQLEFLHPVTRAPLALESPWPADLAGCWDAAAESRD